MERTPETYCYLQVHHATTEIIILDQQESQTNNVLSKSFWWN